MSVEAALKYEATILKDGGLHKKVLAAVQGKSIEEAAGVIAGLASAAGYAASAEEVLKTQDLVMVFLRSRAKGAAKGELSDAELAAVAGGTDKYGNETDEERQRRLEAEAIALQDAEQRRWEEEQRLNQQHAEEWNNWILTQYPNGHPGWR